MATKAFVLIETRVGANREVIAVLMQLSGVRSADMVTGAYDVIATVEAETLSAVGDIVTGKPHPIPGISRTVTCLVI